MFSPSEICMPYFPVSFRVFWCLHSLFGFGISTLRSVLWLCCVFHVFHYIDLYHALFGWMSPYIYGLVGVALLWNVLTNMCNLTIDHFKHRYYWVCMGFTVPIIFGCEGPPSAVPYLGLCRISFHTPPLSHYKIIWLGSNRPTVLPGVNHLYILI